MTGLCSVSLQVERKIGCGSLLGAIAWNVIRGDALILGEGTFALPVLCAGMAKLGCDCLTFGLPHPWNKLQSRISGLSQGRWPNPEVLPQSLALTMPARVLAFLSSELLTEVSTWLWQARSPRESLGTRRWLLWNSHERSPASCMSPDSRACCST